MFVLYDMIKFPPYFREYPKSILFGKLIPSLPNTQLVPSSVSFGSKTRFELKFSFNITLI